MAIEEAVDEMKVTGTATPSADGKLAGDVRIGARGERRRFLVADVNSWRTWWDPSRSDESVIRMSRSSE